MEKRLDAGPGSTIKALGRRTQGVCRCRCLTSRLIVAAHSVLASRQKIWSQLMPVRASADVMISRGLVEVRIRESERACVKLRT